MHKVFMHLLGKPTYCTLSHTMQFSFFACAQNAEINFHRVKRQTRQMHKQLDSTQLNLN